MPEAPDLEVIRGYLSRLLTGKRISSARELRPLVLRNLTGRPFADDISGRVVEEVSRRGKLLLIGLSGARLIIINPMLAGGIRCCRTDERASASTHIAISFENGQDLRYFDRKRMGMVYYLRPDQAAAAPRLEGRGPDVLDEPLSLPEFQKRLRRFRGEIKGILTRGMLVSGIGNAYADEILFEARIFPFKKRAQLDASETARLHAALYEVPRRAVETIRGRLGTDIHRKLRDFLKVHRRGGKPCPACGRRITAITANRRETNFCRGCQPGLLLRN